MFISLLSAGGDGTISLFDIEEQVNKPKMSFEPAIHIKKYFLFVLILIIRSQRNNFGVSCVQWYSHDTGMFFTGSYDGSVRVWDTNTQQVFI